MIVWLLEDDHLQAESIIETVMKTLKIPRSDIVWMKTEHQFYQRLDSEKVRLPNLAILDVMVRWTDSAPNMPSPPENVRIERHHRAGARCCEKLRAIAPNIPVIFYTILSEEDLFKGPYADVIASGTVITKAGNSKALIKKLLEFGA